MPAASIVIDLLMKTGSFETDTQRAEKRMRSFKKEAIDTQKALRSAFAGLTGLFSTAALVGFGKEAITAARDAEQANARIQATLKATGFAAGLTSQQLDGFAESLAKSTQFDDDSIRNAEAEFLKFGNIQKDVFERGLKLSADLAAFMGSDVASAAQIVGKALSSPAEAVGTLERQIGKLTKAQEDSIKRHLEAGDAAKAQAEVLDILQGKIGGTAALMNTGWTKATKDLEKAWGELLETIGKTGFAQTQFTALGGFINDLNNQIAGVDDTYRNTLAQMVKDTAKYMPGLYGGLTYLFGKGLEAPQTRQEVSGQITFNTPTGSGGGTGVNLPTLPTLKPVKAADNGFAREYAEDMAQLISKFNDAAQPSQTLADKLQDQLDAYTVLDPAVRKYLQGITDTVREQERAAKSSEQWSEIMRLQSDSDNMSLQALEESSREAADAIDEFKKRSYQAWVDGLPAAERLGMQIDEVRMAAERLGLSQDFANPIIDQMRRAEEETKKAATELNAVGKDLGLTFSSAFEDAIVGGKKLSDILQSLEQDIARIVTRKLVTEPLANAVTKFVGGFDFGNLLGGIFGGARASGGDVIAGRSYLVGEHGPERFVPRTAGVIIPSSNISAKQGNVYLTMNVQTQDANSFRKSQEQIMADMQRQLNRGRRVM